MQTAEKLPLELSAGAVKWTLKQLRFILRRESALHTQLATSSVCIGPAKASDSYLNMQNILSAALNTGCDAIHPGFGFLSENSDFARLCKACGLVFIGPDYQVIDSMGNKSAARELMKRNGVPVVPGSDGSVLNLCDAKRTAAEIGYPVLVKASAGGRRSRNTSGVVGNGAGGGFFDGQSGSCGMLRGWRCIYRKAYCKSVAHRISDSR